MTLLGRWRIPLRLSGYDYSQPGDYFVTMNTKDRERLFGTIEDGHMLLNDFGEIVAACWRDLPNHYPYIKIDEFVVMPDHVHGIIVIKANPVREGSEPSRTEHSRADTSRTDASLPRRHPLSEIVRSFKTFSARRINEIRGVQGVPVWQRNYFEHIIRNEQSLKRIREYISLNPKAWNADVDSEQYLKEDEPGAWLKSTGLSSTSENNRT